MRLGGRRRRRALKICAGGAGRGLRWDRWRNGAVNMELSGRGPRRLKQFRVFPCCLCPMCAHATQFDS